MYSTYLFYMILGFDDLSSSAFGNSWKFVHIVIMELCEFDSN